MAYITAKQVKEKREQIKKLFPAKHGWKFSIKTLNYSTIKLSVLEAPIELREDTSKHYEQMSKYRFSDRKNVIGADLLQIMFDIINQGNYNNSDIQTDYFDIGFYTSITIGEWNIPFKCITNNHDNGLPKNWNKN
jgi:Large polyvalent protein associated domain 29